jgi:hypothetical protein
MKVCLDKENMTIKAFCQFMIPWRITLFDKLSLFLHSCQMLNHNQLLKLSLETMVQSLTSIDPHNTETTDITL